MPSEAKLLLTTQTEKPTHYRYLKEFRVEQCQLFPLHKCTQHRPFTCFNWHFPNQKRRRPVRKRDGTFNYSPDSYCTKFDETNGTCPDGDECPFLHRTAGDTERRYHLRYFKTSMCVYETDNRGCCTKNGVHCAFAHGEIDKRPPVFDIRELQLQQQTQEPIEESLVSNGFTQLDKERNLLIEDPKWQDANYVLVHYKTEPCKRPPRLCRQGYACPQYHNLRDRRRSPKKHKYRSTPCPNVKHTDEWGEPTACMDGDDCSYCHTRTEQQFHPEIYKSSKCNDVFTNQYCPRGPFCAFAHADHEMSINRNMPSDTNLADILSNVLPANSSNNTALGLAMNASESNNLNLISPSNTNNNETIDPYMGLTMNKQGNEFSDSLLDSPELYQFGLNSSNFGAQSFASAVSSYSNVASASGILNGKYYDLDSINKGIDEISNGPIGGSLKNNLISNPFGGVLDNINDYLPFKQEEREGYSLFPSNSKIWDDVYGVEAGRDESRDDSPNTLDKEMDGELFAGGDIALSGNSTKPVSIPVSGFYNRERFPSGSSPISSGLSGLTAFNNLFSKSESLDHNDLSNQQQRTSFFEFVSPKNTMESPRGTNGFNSAAVERGPSASSNSSSNGPIGHNGSEDGFNGGSQSPIISVVGRSDLVYLSVQTLTQLMNSYKIQIEAIHKALNSHKKDSKHYPCLQCKHKDRARTIILVPCDHQVLCKICAPMTSNCPLCRAVIRNRKQMSSHTGNDL